MLWQVALLSVGRIKIRLIIIMSYYEVSYNLYLRLYNVYYNELSIMWYYD